MSELNEAIDFIENIEKSPIVESVSLEDFNGDVNYLRGATVISAEERVECPDNEGNYESVTYTFYDIQTDKGSLWLRWYGTSNGYYSESVNIVVEGGNIE